jgi:flagellin
LAGCLKQIKEDKIMGLRIQTNVAAINAHRQLSITDSALAKSIERLSSGFRVNRAADDAAGLAMSNKFVAQIRAMGAASRNTSQATSLLQIAEGGMDQVTNILTRLKELATQAASANSSANLDDINEEATALKAEITRIANSTTFQGTALLTGYGIHSVDKTLTAANAYGLNVDNAADAQYSVTGTESVSIVIKNMTTSVSQTLTVKASGAQTYDFDALGISFKTTAAATASTIAGLIDTALDEMCVNIDSVAFQVGETNGSNYQLFFKIENIEATSLSVDGIDLSSLTGAQSAMDSIDNAITQLNTTRAKIGAVQNRLGYTYANLAIAVENAGAANSVIKDVDMASEMTMFTKNQILLQAGTAMLAQANMAPQQVLALFG